VQVLGNSRVNLERALYLLRMKVRKIEVNGFRSKSVTGEFRVFFPAVSHSASVNKPLAGEISYLLQTSYIVLTLTKCKRTLRMLNVALQIGGISRAVFWLHQRHGNRY